MSAFGRSGSKRACLEELPLDSVGPGAYDSMPLKRTGGIGGGVSLGFTQERAVLNPIPQHPGSTAHFADSKPKSLAKRQSVGGGAESRKALVEMNEKNKQLEVLERERDKLLAALTDLRKDREALAKRDKDARKEIDRLATDKAKLECRVEQHQKRVDESGELQRHKDALIQDLAGLREERNTIDQKRERWEEEMADIAGDLYQAERTNDTLVEAIRELEDRRTDMQTEHDSLRDEKSSMEEELNTLKATLEVQCVENARLTHEVEACEQQRAGLQGQLESQSADSATVLMALKKEVEEKGCAMEQAALVATQTSQSLAAKEQQCAMMATAMHSLDQRLADAVTVAERAQMDAERSRRTMERMEEEKKTVEQRLAVEIARAANDAQEMATLNQSRLAALQQQAQDEKENLLEQMRAIEVAVEESEERRAALQHEAMEEKARLLEQIRQVAEEGAGVQSILNEELAEVRVEARRREEEDRRLIAEAQARHGRALETVATLEKALEMGSRQADAATVSAEERLTALQQQSDTDKRELMEQIRRLTQESEETQQVLRDELAAVRMAAEG